MQLAEPSHDKNNFSPSPIGMINSGHKLHHWCISFDSFFDSTISIAVISLLYGLLASRSGRLSIASWYGRGRTVVPDLPEDIRPWGLPTLAWSSSPNNSFKSVAIISSIFILKLENHSKASILFQHLIKQTIVFPANEFLSSISNCIFIYYLVIVNIDTNCWHRSVYKSVQNTSETNFSSINLLEESFLYLEFLISIYIIIYVCD